MDRPNLNETRQYCNREAETDPPNFTLQVMQRFGSVHPWKPSQSWKFISKYLTCQIIFSNFYIPKQENPFFLNNSYLSSNSDYYLVRNKCMIKHKCLHVINLPCFYNECICILACFVCFISVKLVKGLETKCRVRL